MMNNIRSTKNPSNANASVVQRSIRRANDTQIVLKKETVVLDGIPIPVKVETVAEITSQANA